MQEVEGASKIDSVTETAQEKRPADEALEAQLLISEAAPQPNSSTTSSATLKAVIEAAIYITDEPLTPEQIASAVEQPSDRVKEVLKELVAEYAAPDRGLSIRELAGGYKMSTKPEHHESIRRFVKN